MDVYDKAEEGLGSRSRVIGAKGHDFTPYDTYLIAWGPFVSSGPPQFCVIYSPSGRRHREIGFDPTVTDLTNHVAFCKGHLPAHAYADWLEESGVDLPAEAYNLLRGWDTTQIT